MNKPEKDPEDLQPLPEVVEEDFPPLTEEEQEEVDAVINGKSE